LVTNLSAQTEASRLVYNFCVQHQGQKVGDGICKTLVDEALQSAGLQQNYDLGLEVWRIASTWRERHGGTAKPKLLIDRPRGKVCLHRVRIKTEG
jgi:hypothetical protein